VRRAAAGIALAVAALVPVAVPLAGTGAVAGAPPPGAAAAAAAGPAARPGYADSVDRALQLLRDAPADDRATAHRAADVLEAGTGQSQREILADLRAEPPAVADARTRLAALARADRSPAFVPAPGQARRDLDGILAQPRYSGLQQGPSPWDRLAEALGRLLVWLLEAAAVTIAGRFGWALVAAVALLLAGAGLLVARSVRWTGRREARAGELTPGPGAVRDRFAAADRLAAVGDLAGAVRELAGGVAAALGDDRAWEVSPLTVRELFARSPDPASLRPLLLAFEAAVYGERAPGPDAYRRAAEAAAPFRPARAAVA
jgi:hypothetical protein